MRKSWLVALGLSSLLLAGCGRPMATVEGHVLFNKKPLPAGEVHFIAADGRSRSSPIGTDGSYRLVDCPMGEVKVAVQAKKLKNPPSQGNPDTFEVSDPGPPPPVFISLIPARYESIETSKLTFTIVRGRQKIDVELHE